MNQFILAGLEVELQSRLTTGEFASLVDGVVQLYADLERTRRQYLEETGMLPEEKIVVFQDLGETVGHLEGRFGKVESFNRIRRDIDEMGILFGRKYGLEYQPTASPEQ